MRLPTFAAVGAMVTFVAAGLGCEIISSIDRSKLSTGTANATGGGGTGGGGTGGAACAAPTDCAQPSGECQQATCTAGVCGTAPKAAGTKTTAQVTGDCKVKQCDGNGSVADAPDDTDLPVDGNDCTGDVCTAGTPSNPALPMGAACGAGGALHCDGAGKCVACLQPTDCGMDAECKHPTCTAGVCGVTNEPQGKHLAAQSPGDCKVSQCDGHGGTEVVDDNTDLPVDGTVCTSDVCTAGVPTNPPVAAATACHEGSGTLCNGSGQCVACLQPTDCPGSDTECQKRTCSAAGACGVSFTAAGTLTASQTAGDCKKNVCDGAGAVTSAGDNTDVPDDNNPCTDDTCAAGVPTFTAKALGASCGASLVCDAAGHCQGCNVATDCPGVDDECKTRTCTSGTCSFSFTASGTAVSAQTPGDCKKNVCNGSGTVVIQNDNADLPADDGNPCTSETCNAGVPGHPALPINTVCPTGFCSAAAACVACNAPTQCPGSDTDCHARTCVLNACGVSNTASGTPTSSQTPGDCKENQCDGNGGVMVVNKDTDLPLDDGNPCTNEICTSGTPSHPAEPLNTPCNQGGGSYCNSTGSCVQCNQGSQCASMVCLTGACQAATCTDGVKNGTETDVDCGGSCPNQCASGQGCAANADCATGACDTASMTCSIICSESDAPGADCNDYCGCMLSACPATFATMTDCLNACSIFVQDQLCCRTEHCGYAMTDPGTHCPHASGQSLCP